MTVVTDRPKARRIPTCVVVGLNHSLVITRASEGEDVRVTPDTPKKLAALAWCERLDQSI
jgi:hypothetical protein